MPTTARAETHARVVGSSVLPISLGYLLRDSMKNRAIITSMSSQPVIALGVGILLAYRYSFPCLSCQVDVNTFLGICYGLITEYLLVSPTAASTGWILRP
jgi:hypothetical protein